MAKVRQWLRSKEVAHVLDCCPDEVVALARKGKLRAFRVGRFWAFRFADVVSFKRTDFRESCGCF